MGHAMHALAPTFDVSSKQPKLAEVVRSIGERVCTRYFESQTVAIGTSHALPVMSPATANGSARARERGDLFTHNARSPATT